LKTIAGRVSQQGLQLKVVGTFDDPKVERKALPAPAPITKPSAVSKLAKPAPVAKPALVSHPALPARSIQLAAPSAPAEPSVSKPATVIVSTGDNISVQGVTAPVPAKPATVTTSGVSIVAPSTNPFGVVNVTAASPAPARTVYDVVTTNGVATVVAPKVATAGEVKYKVNLDSGQTIKADPFVRPVFGTAFKTLSNLQANPITFKALDGKFFEGKPFTTYQTALKAQNTALKSLYGKTSTLKGLTGFGSAKQFYLDSAKGLTWSMGQPATNSPVIDLDLKNAQLGETLRLLAKKGKLSMVINSGKYNDVTIVLSNVSVTKAIHVTSRAAGAAVRYEGGVYYISPAKQP